jgi:hypothetical protein
MRQRDLTGISIDKLVQLFAALAVEQDACMLENDISKANRLYDQLHDVVVELKSRPGDQRGALISLYRHSNMQVRVKAAKNTLAVAPQAAREQLEAIVASKWQPYAGDAGMCLRSLDSGIFEPT